MSQPSASASGPTTTAAASSSSSSSGPTPDLSSILADITAAPPPPPAALAAALRAVARRDVGEAILASLLPGGADPLGVLEPAANTVGYLFILTARLSVVGAPPITLPTIAKFCAQFEPEQARCAPERVTLLARSIVHLADSQKMLKAAIAPLYDLVTRYPPSLDYLTTVHQYFLHACVATQHYKQTLPVLSTPISEIDTTLSPLTYHDVLNYHYTGGLALLALKRFQEASAFLEACVSAPANTHPAALQYEALKKLVLVRLILYGTTPPLPKYAHPNLWRYFKSTPYAAFAKAYLGPLGALREIVDKDARVFENERNMGLVRQALAHAPRWAVRTLTATYVTLSLPELARALGEAADEEGARELVLSMIERGEIDATLDAAGTVTFHVAPADPADVDALLRQAQEQGAVLGELDREVGKSREFLTKAMKEKEGGAMDELELYGAGPPPPGYRDWDDSAF